MDYCNVADMGHLLKMVLRVRKQTMKAYSIQKYTCYFTASKRLHYTSSITIKT